MTNGFRIHVERLADTALERLDRSTFRHFDLELKRPTSVSIERITPTEGKGANRDDLAAVIARNYKDGAFPFLRYREIRRNIHEGVERDRDLDSEQD